MDKYVKSILISLVLSSWLLSGGVVLAVDPYQNVQGYNGAYDISKGRGVVVAIISGGVQIDHPDLKHAIWNNEKEVKGNKKDDDKNGYIDDLNGWNFIDKNNDLKPKDIIGTNMAGIIAGKPDNHIGVAGIAPEVQIMPLTACNAKACDKQAIISSIDYAVKNGANIIVFGLGASGVMAYSKDYDKAISEAYSKGVLVVAPTGNGDVKSTKQVGKDLDKIKLSPISNGSEDVNMVLGAGATKKSSYMVTNWTNYGGKYTDIWVPGQDLVTTTVPALAKKLEYETVSGTNLAAAVVAGSAALLMSKYPDYAIYEVFAKMRNTTPFNIYTLLTNTVYTSFCSIKYFNKTINNGEVLVLEASNLRPTTSLVLIRNTDGLVISIPASDISIVDYNKLRLDTSKEIIPAGTYGVGSTTCEVEGKLIVKGDLKKPNACSLKDIKSCTREGLVSLIAELLKKK